MKNALCFCCLSLIFHASALAQKDSFSFKIYSHLPVFDNRMFLGFDNLDDRAISFQGFGYAIQWQKNERRIKELELTRLQWWYRDDGQQGVETVVVGFRYETSYLKANPKAAKLRWRWGWSVEPYFSFRSELTWNQTAPPMSQECLGAAVSITPHFECSISKNLFFDFNPHLKVVNFSVRSERVFDPIFDEEQSQSIDFFILPFRGMLRLGLGWRFFKKEEKAD